MHKIGARKTKNPLKKQLVTKSVVIYNISHFFSFQVVIFYLSSVYSQHGPAPHRLPIPAGAIPAGSVPIPLRPNGQYRNERLLAGPNPNAGFIRIRRPLHLAARQNNFNNPPQNNLGVTDEAKPVTEEPESGEQQTFLPQFPQPQPQSQSAQPNLPAILYSINENGENFSPQNRAIDFPSSQFTTTDRIIPTTLRSTGGQRFALNQPQPSAQPKPVSKLL